MFAADPKPEGSAESPFAGRRTGRKLIIRRIARLPRATVRLEGVVPGPIGAVAVVAPADMARRQTWLRVTRGGVTRLRRRRYRTADDHARPEGRQRIPPAVTMPAVAVPVMAIAPMTVIPAMMTFAVAPAAMPYQINIVWLGYGNGRSRHGLRWNVAGKGRRSGKKDGSDLLHLNTCLLRMRGWWSFQSEPAMNMIIAIF